jgi:hypothetical protein
VAFQRITDVQKMTCPTDPKILNPVSVVKSFVPSEDQPYEDQPYKEGVDQLRQLVEDWARKTETIKSRLQREPDLEERDWIKDIKGAKKDKQLNEDQKIGVLAGVDLNEAYLKKAKLRSAHLEGAFLKVVHLEGADLEDAHLEGAYLRHAHLEGADLKYAHLEGAKLGEANLEGADLKYANLEGAYLGAADLKNACLCKADLKNVRNLTLKQLSQAFSLYGVKNLGSKLKKRIKKKYPHLLEPNYEVSECNDEKKGEGFLDYIKKQKQLTGDN